MHSRVSRALLPLAFCLWPVDLRAESARFSFHIGDDDPGPWSRILSSAGLVEGSETLAGVFVVPGAPASQAAEWQRRVEGGAILILEGDSGLAQAFGFRPLERRVAARNVVDIHNPKIPIIWQRTLELPFYQLPADAVVFARERWESAPLVAGMRRGAGAVLWVAVRPGDQGHERFPYLIQTLVDLGLEPPFQSRRLWAFFDASYRSRVDLDYFARRWRSSGVSALHVASWHFFEPDPERDQYLARLIEACHRRAIQVYAWIELPHVSEKFWQDHASWREKTALLQDAHLDWRKLMNLQNPDCQRAIAAGLGALLDRFNWDGVNLAELYFESLEGHTNAARFTPMNDDVRREFTASGGFDPLDLFDASGPRHHARNPAGLRAFLDYRAQLARRMQAAWIAEIEQVRARRRHLDLVLTHVDDRFDTRMRDLIGADAERLLPLLDHHDFTFLIEDPATIWHLGPERYPKIAERYHPLTTHRDKLAIDINIVERYQDVYPTRQQTGLELFRLVQLASRAFPRVALYFENSILPPDLPLLAAATAVVDRVARSAGKLVIQSPTGVGVRWSGAAMVDGRLWPVADDRTVWLPPGQHAIEPAAEKPPLRLLDFNGDLRSAAAMESGIEFSYRSTARAIAVVDKRPGRVMIDGAPAASQPLESGPSWALLLPRGQHVATVEAAGRAVSARESSAARPGRP